MIVAALIPTRGDRPDFLEYARYQLNRQTRKPDIIMVVDDPALTEKKDITWRYREGIDRCKKAKADVIFFIEDDDWYSPKYIETMLELWKTNGRNHLFGLDSTTYYHLGIQSYLTVSHPNRSSMYNSMITKDFTLKQWCASDEPYVDIHIWKFGKNKKTVTPPSLISLGIKHGIGMCGGAGHDIAQYQNSIYDKDLSFLKQTVGSDFEFYYRYVPKEPPIRFGIVVTIYRRKDGKSPQYLKRCLDSIQAQTYPNYEVVVIGDYYENDSEITGLIPPHFKYWNNPQAYERWKYSGERLWCCGGLNSTLIGIGKLSTDYVMLLDYDDYWSPDHLKLFADLKKFDFACTKSTHVKNKLPHYNGSAAIVPMIPRPCGMIKSSICWNRTTFIQLPRNVYEETGIDFPSDADLLKRFAANASGKKCFFINKLTCFHDEEGTVKQKFTRPSRKVSVVIVCYNQEKYIGQAIESVLKQKTQHSLEIIVSDDRSRDGTYRIIKEYAAKNSIIKINRNVKNLGVTLNYKKAFKLCTGDYVAFCEGDDWWTDPEKIDKQVAYLEENKDCSACYSFFRHYEVAKNIYSDVKIPEPYKKSIHDVIRIAGCPGNFSSIMYRKDLLDQISPKLYDMIAYDWAHTIAMAQFGFIGVIPEVMNIRRLHVKGVWTGCQNKMDQIKTVSKKYIEFFGDQYSADFESIWTKQQTQANLQFKVIPPKALTNSKTLTVVTCTGDRPEAFELCKHWLSRQTIQPTKWIVVDDGKEPMDPPSNCFYIRRQPKESDPPHTLCLNLMEGLEEVDTELVAIFEDDDWYSPQYLETMLGFMDQYDMVGVGSLVFYSLRHPGWNYRPKSRQPALYQTIFNKHVIPFVSNLCQNVYNIKGLAEKGLLDGQLWQQTGYIADTECVIITEAFDSPMGKLKKGMSFYPPYPPFIQRRLGTQRLNHKQKPIKKYIYDPEVPIAIGIKNMPGRSGLTQAQKSGLKFYTYDKGCEYLKKLIGNDIQYYERFINGY